MPLINVRPIENVCTWASRRSRNVSGRAVRGGRDEDAAESGRRSAGCPSAALMGRPVDAVERSMDLRLSAGGLGRYVVITIGGELDMTTAPALAEYLSAVLGWQAGQDVILDVRGVSFADVAGLRALLAADCTVKDSGGSLRLAGAPRQLRRALAITGLTERLPSYPSTYAASAWPPIPATGSDPEPCAGPRHAPRPSRPGEDLELFFPISARGSAGRRCAKQGRRRPRQDHHLVHVIRRLRPGSRATPQPQKE